MWMVLRIGFIPTSHDALRNCFLWDDGIPKGHTYVCIGSQKKKKHKRERKKQKSVPERNRRMPQGTLY